MDANVPLYTIGSDNDFRPSCLAVLQAAVEDRLRAVTDAEVIQEIAYQSSGRGRRALGIDLGERFMAIMASILPVEKQDLEAALALMRTEARFSPRDAIHVAIMQRHGITHIITADKHFRDIPGITALDPPHRRRDAGRLRVAARAAAARPFR